MPQDGSQAQVLQLDQAREWLEIVYSETPGLIHICGTQEWQGRIFESGDVEGALAYIQHLDQRPEPAGDSGLKPREGIYLRACTLRQAPQAGSRGGDDLSFYLPGLWGDIDIAGPGHKSRGTLPPTAEEAMRIVSESGLPEPSHWIHSGGGLYPWWLLKYPVQVDDLEYLRSVSAGWQMALLRSALKIGYAYGSGVGDLSRVLRIPGTVNRKQGLERPCGPLEGHAWSGKLYDFQELVEALEAVTPAPEPPKPPRPIEIKFGRGIQGERPGDEFNRTADWHDLLPDWQWVRRVGDTWYLRRPGKLHGGHSATLRLSTDRLYVFSEEASPFEPFKLYDKFGAYALLHHGGNFESATRTLGQRGYGNRSMDVAAPSSSPTLGNAGNTHQETSAGSDIAPVAQQTIEKIDQAINSALDVFGIPDYGRKQLSHMEWDGIGVSRKWVELHQDSFLYAADQKHWMRWTGVRWEVDARLRHEHAAVTMVDRMLQYAKAVERENPEVGKPLVAQAKKMSYAPQVQGILKNARSDPRVATCAQDFDKDPTLLTMRNGVLNLETLELKPHDPKMMLTRQVNAAFEPQAAPGRWDRFVEEVLPDPAVRSYVQRLCGYMITGRMTERALVLFYGESGTGKTQFLEALREVLGDFAGVAQPSTFQARTAGYKGPSEDLHKLMGKRLVIQSELDATTRFNEALVKSIVGADTQSTRPLYGAPVDWQPEYTVFLATNHLPRISSAENAIWNRVKPIKFERVFIDDRGEALNPADKGLGRRMAQEEPEKIINWILAGLKEYREQGLGEPDQVHSWLQEYREDTDTARQFINEIEDHDRVRLESGASAPVREVYQAYLGWASDNGMTPLGMRSFGERLESMGFERGRTSKQRTWIGIRTGHGWLADAQIPTGGRGYIPLRQ